MLLAHRIELSTVTGDCDEDDASLLRSIMRVCAQEHECSYTYDVPVCSYADDVPVRVYTASVLGICDERCSMCGAPWGYCGHSNYICMPCKSYEDV